MDRPPRHPRESVFSADVKAFIMVALFIETPFFYLLFFHDFSDIARARTEIFFLFITVELAIALNFRSLRFSVFKVPPHRWLILAILSQVVLVSALIQIPTVRSSFGIVRPDLSMIALILGFTAFVFLAMEAVKAVMRRRASRP
jgi:Ca2+-transporting ATPase